MGYEFSETTTELLMAALEAAGFGIAGGIIAATLLSILGYGIFRAFSLINIK